MKNKYSIGIIIFVIFLITILINPQLTPNTIQLPNILKPPSFGTPFWSGLLGYDELGRSIINRLIVGSVPAFTVAIAVVSLSMIIGVTVGLIAAYFRGWVDTVIIRIIDIFLAFPGLLLAIILAGILGPGLINIVIALSAMGWVGFARLTRSQALSLRNQDFVSAAISQGQTTPTILFKHILPLGLAPILVESTFAFAGSILAEAGLSFLGLGIQPPEASWGQMIKTGAQYLLVAPHLVIVPGVTLWLAVLLINQLGEYFQRKVFK